MNGHVVYKIRWCLIALLVLIEWQQSNSQTPGSRQDNIPRQRLITNSEFASLLDPSFSASQSTPQETIQRYLDHLKNRIHPRYFFTSSDLRERINYFTKSYRDTVLAMKRDAEEFIERFGCDVDWMRPGQDKMGNQHTPNTVRALSRQRYAESIVLQYFFHRDESYIKFWFSHVQDFVNDVEAGNVERGANDIFERFYAGHRLRNWLAVHHLLLGEKTHSTDDQLMVLKTLILNAANIYDQCRKFSYGNHQLVGAEALYETTLMFPEFPFMREWNVQAKKIILEHSEKEITASGFQLERSSHYHKLDIVNYLRFYRLAVLNNDPLPESFSSRFKGMFMAMMNVATPNKQMPLLQDVTDSAYSRFDDISDEMSVGALLFNEPQFRFFGKKNFPASYFWFFSLSEIKHYATIPSSRPLIGSIRLEGSDYFVMRNGWDARSQYLLIDGGSALQKPDHTHGGVLGMILAAEGELFLPNYAVRYSEPRYHVLKNSFAKNVAIVDSQPQANGWIGNAAKTGFGKWSTLPKPTISHWVSNNDYDYFSGTHDGFHSIGVQYSRSIVYVKNKYWVVIDDFTSSSSTHTYQQLWQGHYSVDTATKSTVQRIGNSELVLIQLDKDLQCHNTTVADIYPSIWFEARNKLNHRFVTLLYPRSGDNDILPSIVAAVREGNEIFDVRYGTQSDRIQIQNGLVQISTHSLMN